jgi:class 3 adenylate cyclase
MLWRTTYFAGDGVIANLHKLFGLPLTSSTPSPAKALAANGAEGTAPTSARKYVTVLFADISGFTAMSEKLDSEDVTDLMNGCLSRMADVVMKYEGYVDKFVGDCIMALFGAPIAHEKDRQSLRRRNFVEGQRTLLHGYGPVG